MSVSRPSRIGIGDEIGLRGSSYTVSAIAAGTVALTAVTGMVTAVSLAEMLSDPSLEVLSPASRAALPRRGVLDGLPADVVDRAEWWERHVVEILTGLPPGSQADATPRPEYDPVRRSLRQRELDKLAELEADGEQVSLTMLGRMRRRYQSDGLLGLVTAGSFGQLELRLTNA